MGGNPSLIQVGLALGFGVAYGAAVHQSGYLYPSLKQLRRQAVARVIIGHYHGAAPWLHTVEVHKPLRSSTQHDSRKVIVAEDIWYLLGSGSYDYGVGTKLDYPLTLQDAKEVPLVKAERIGVVEDSNVGEVVQCLGQLRRKLESCAALTLDQWRIPVYVGVGP